MDGRWSVWIGFDPREAQAFAVCRQTIEQRLTQPIPIHGVVLDELRKAGLYTRPMELRPLYAPVKYKNGYSLVDADGNPVEALVGEQMWDVISDAPMSTEFACSRFLTPILAGGGLALFMDCDMLVRTSVCRLFEQYDPRYAVMVVKHHHEPEPGMKMDGQLQTRYARKNWSSVMLFNCEHPANKKLTVELVNTVPGRDLHRFCWLEDDEIGELDPRWNYLVGHSNVEQPHIVHFTEGIPTMPGYEQCEFSDEWRAELGQWAR